MGSVPGEHTGVAAGTNGTFLQTGGALGVAVIGSLLSSTYQDHLTSALASHPVAPAIKHTALDSVGGALGVAGHVGGVSGAHLADAAREAFIAGMNLGLRTGAIVALAGAAFALLVLPGREELRRRRRSHATSTTRTRASHSPGPSSPAR